MFTIRNQRNAVLRGYWIKSTMLLFLVGLWCLPVMFLCALNAVISPLFARALSKYFISTATCYHCGYSMDLDQLVMHCGCGFTYAGAHLFDLCPSCKGEFDQTSCPSCRVSLVI